MAVATRSKAHLLSNGGSPTPTRDGNGHSSKKKRSTHQPLLHAWDPTRIFSVLVIVIMSVRFYQANDLVSLVWGFYLHPVVLVSVAVATTPVLVWSSQNAHSIRLLSDNDKMAIEWYWWNAWLYHAVMDGASGSFQLVPVVVQQYFVLDGRFRSRHVVPWCIGVIELCIMAPMCLLTIHAILKQSAWRYPLEIVTSTLQLFGMIMFVLAEVYEGQVNVPALDPVGVSGIKFNVYHLTYYWFGFWFCNLVWGFVPIYRIVRAVKECQQAIMDGDGSKDD